MATGGIYPTVCLNMIVKDEAHVIERCLANVRSLIDAWCIVDTGSTDGTQDIVRTTMTGIPGDLYERPWRNFGHNRSEAIALAAGRADWILTVDADETLDRDKNFTWSGLRGDAAMVTKRRGTRAYRVMAVVRDGLDWFWSGAVHEHLESPHPVERHPLDGIEILSPREGARAYDPMTYRRDALMLEEALLENPDDARAVFYLAQSYRDAGEYALAGRHYRRRATMGGWEEEADYALFQAARMTALEGKPWGECLAAYLAAHERMPRRAEPLYEIGMACAARKEWASAWLFLSRAAGLARPEDALLFVEEDVYAWRAAMEAAVAAYWAGRDVDAVALNRALLEGTALPPDRREQVRANLGFSEARMPGEDVRRFG